MYLNLCISKDKIPSEPDSKLGILLISDLSKIILK